MFSPVIRGIFHFNSWIFFLLIQSTFPYNSGYFSRFYIDFFAFPSWGYCFDGFLPSNLRCFVRCQIVKTLSVFQVPNITLNFSFPQGSRGLIFTNDVELYFGCSFFLMLFFKALRGTFQGVCKCSFTQVLSYISFHAVWFFFQIQIILYNNIVVLFYLSDFTLIRFT